MKKNIALSLLMVFILLSSGYAEKSSEEYLFTRDFINCLYSLRAAATYNTKATDYAAIIKNFRSQLPHLKVAKGFMEKWLKSENVSVQVAAWHTHSIISIIETLVSKTLDLLVKPSPGNTADIQRYVSQNVDHWNKIYETTGYVFKAMLKPAKYINPKEKIPFIISDKDRQRLVKYINKVFKEDSREYDKLVSQKKQGAIKEFSLTIPVWSVLHLRRLLTSETYADIEKIDYLNLGS